MTSFNWRFSLLVTHFQLTHRGLFFFQVLGTPTRDEIKRMNPNYTEFKFPQIKAHPWHKVKATYFSFFPLVWWWMSSIYIIIYILWNIMVHIFHQIFHKRMPSEAVDFVSRLLQYSPNLRCTAVCIKHFILGNPLHLTIIFSFSLTVGGVNPSILWWTAVPKLTSTKWSFPSPSLQF